MAADLRGERRGRVGARRRRLPSRGARPSRVLRGDRVAVPALADRGAHRRGRAAPAPSEAEPAADGAAPASPRGGGSRAARGRRGCDGARQGVPDARTPRGAARPARVRADGRPGARRDPTPSTAHARAPGADPGPAAPALGAGRHAARRAAPPARGLHGLDRVRDRAHLGSRGARLAAQGDRVGTVPREPATRATRGAAAAALAGRGLRAVPATLVPRSEAVLAGRARRRSSRCSTRRSSWRRRAARTRS